MFVIVEPFDETLPLIKMFSSWNKAFAIIYLFVSFFDNCYNRRFSQEILIEQPLRSIFFQPRLGQSSFVSTEELSWVDMFESRSETQDVW